MGFEKHESDLKFFKKDGTEIALVGANAENLAENFRGLAVPLVVIDEAASFRQHLSYLIDEVITPTLVDYDGTVALIGTPSAACFGAFFDATTSTNSMYSVHHWTIMNNPHIAHAKSWLDNYRVQKGWSEENPIYQREWLGRWVKSEDSLVYKIRDYNFIDKHELKNPKYIFGIDLGYEDSNAIVVLAFDYGSPYVFIIDEFKKSNQTISELADVLKSMIEQYDPIHIVADTGGLGKSIVQELNHRHAFAIKPAEKAHKYSNIELFNADLIDGKIKLIQSRTQKLTMELNAMQWDQDLHKVDSRCEDHLADAALYGFMASKHYTYEPKVEIKTDPNKLMEEYWEKKEEQLNADSQKSWWDDI